MLENEEIVDLFKKSLSATVKSIGKSRKIEINFVDKNPSINGEQVNLANPSLSSLKNILVQMIQLMKFSGFWNSLELKQKDLIYLKELN